MLPELVEHVRTDLLRHPGQSPERVATSVVAARAPLLDDHELRAVVQDVLDRLHGLGPLEPLLADPTINELMVNGGRDVWVEQRGTVRRVGALAPGEIDGIVERVIAPLGLRLDRASPIVDARLLDGSRLCAVLPPLAVDGTCVSIRRFAARPHELDAFASPHIASLMLEAMKRRCNVIVSGATSSGKTTLLNALARCVPDGERIITIEDNAELRLEAAHVLRLESRAATRDGVGDVGIRDLLRAALRLRPDRLVVGEVRGAEAFDMLQAMSTGHDGSLATCHANDCDDALRRIEAMAMQAGGALPLNALRSVLHSAVDVVVQVDRQANGARRIVQVAEVAPDPADPTRSRPLARGDEVVGALTRSRR